MTAQIGAMHVARNKRVYVTKSGEEKTYESVLLRRTYREAGKVKHETLTNLKALPADAVAAVEATLKGQRLVPAGSEFTVTRSLPHGHVAAVTAMAHQLGLPALLGPSCRARDLVLALIISRVWARPRSWPPPPGGPMSPWDPISASPARATDEIYAAMDWLLDRQEAIEKQLAARHLDPSVNPGRMALFDLTSSWVTGRCCELAARGYSRDGKKGCEKINTASSRPGGPAGRGAGV